MYLYIGRRSFNWKLFLRSILLNMLSIISNYSYLLLEVYNLAIRFIKKRVPFKYCKVIYLQCSTFKLPFPYSSFLIHYKFIYNNCSFDKRKESFNKLTMIPFDLLTIYLSTYYCSLVMQLLSRHTWKSWTPGWCFLRGRSLASSSSSRGGSLCPSLWLILDLPWHHTHPLQTVSRL